MIKKAWESLFSVFTSPWLPIMQLQILTRINYRLPLAAPLVQLLSVLLFHFGPLHEAGHNVVAGLVGLLSSMHSVYIITRLGGGERW